MKYLLTLLFLVSFAAFAQEPIYTPMRQSYQFRTIRVDSLFLIPSFADTTAANNSTMKNVPGAMIRTGNDFWMRNTATNGWLQNVNVGSGASPTLNFVNEVFKKNGTDSVFYVVAPADTFFSFKDLGVDTTSLSNRINQKVDSIKRSNDSIFFKKNSIWYYSYKDSLGQPVNFANTNLRATGSRTHSFADNSLYIDSIQNLTLKSNAIGQYGIIGNSSGEPYLLSLDQVDFSMSNVVMTKDSAFYGGTKSGSYFGLRTNSDANNISLIRGPNKAFLSRRDFGIDTIALKSDIIGGSQGLNSVLSIEDTATDKQVWFKKTGSDDRLVIENKPSWYPFVFMRYQPNWTPKLMQTLYASGIASLMRGNTGWDISEIKLNVWDSDTATIELTSTGTRKNYLMAPTYPQTGSVKHNRMLLPDSTGTIALRVNGVAADSKGNITIPIGGTDSPDRIDGTATGPVNANMNANEMYFTQSKTFSIRDTSGVDGSLDINMGSIILQSEAKTYIKGLPTASPTLDTILSIDANGKVHKQGISSLAGVSLQSVIDYDNSLINGNLYIGDNSTTGGGGNEIIAIGTNAGNNLSGGYNQMVLIGNNAGADMSAANSLNNTIAIGENAGYDTDWGGIFIGKNAGNANLSSGNVFIGEGAGQNNGVSSYNSLGIGNNALKDNTGTNTIGIGPSAGMSNTGSGIFIGSYAGTGYTDNSGSNVISLATVSNGPTNSYSNVILLGNDASADADNQLVISNGSINSRIDYSYADANKKYTLPKSQGHFVVNSVDVVPDLSAVGNYVILNGGVYTFDGVNGGDVTLPDPSTLPGQQIIINNIDGSDKLFFVGTLPLQTGQGNTMDFVSQKHQMILFSDGVNWRGKEQL